MNPTPRMKHLGVQNEKSYAQLLELRKCVVCKVEVRSSQHQMLQCSHRFCTHCFNKLKDKHQLEQTDQLCPADGSIIDFTNTFREQIRIAKEKAERHVRTVSHMRELVIQRDEKFKQLKEDAIIRKGRNEKLSGLLKQKYEMTQEIREASSTAREGLSRIQDDLEQELAKVKKTAKLENRELNSITKQWNDFDGRLGEYSENYEKNKNEALRHFTQIVGYIYEDDSETEKSCDVESCEISHEKM